MMFPGFIQYYFTMSCLVKRKKSFWFAWEVGRLLFFGDWLLGRDEDFDWFGLFCDSSRWFGEGVDEGAALFIDPELDSPGRRAHDVQ
jgi:hypothetical protein